MNRIIEKAASIIVSGGTVAFPTETVYGLGADARNEQAVAKIFAIKKRPEFDPLIVHIGSPDQAEHVAAEIPPEARRLMDQFWPGPLTMIVRKRSSIPDLVTAGLPGVGIRMPDNPIALELINSSHAAISAPSANSFGCISPTCADHVRADLGDAVDLIIDGGCCDVGVESTIVSFMESRPTLLRPGGIALEDIEEIIGTVHVPERDELKHASPGRFSRHYAPGTPLILTDTITELPEGKRMGLLTIGKPVEDAFFHRVENLSPTEDLSEAACNLFSALKRLDAAHLDLIVATSVPDTGLGRAINDRLFRASQKRDSFSG
ncbi:MAG: L-threonylcarbamoyladenylate synthase [Chitinivibrionales bacterium]